MKNSTLGNLISLWLFNLSNCLWKIQLPECVSYIFSLSISKQWKVIRDALYSFFPLFKAYAVAGTQVKQSYLVSFWSFSQSGNINQFFLSRHRLLFSYSLSLSRQFSSPYACSKPKYLLFLPSTLLWILNRLMKHFTYNK